MSVISIGVSGKSGSNTAIRPSNNFSKYCGVVSISTEVFFVTETSDAGDSVNPLNPITVKPNIKNSPQAATVNPFSFRTVHRHPFLFV